MPEISPGRPHPNLPWRRETVGRSPDETGVNAVRVRLAVDDATSLSMAQVGRVARLPHQMASWLRFGNAAQPTMRLRVGTTTGAVHRARCHLMRVSNRVYGRSTRPAVLSSWGTGRTKSRYAADLLEVPTRVALFIYLIGDYMKLLLALFAAALLVACDSNAGLPTIDREMSNIRVDGGGTVRKFHDADTGVTCYYIGYRAMSCVKTN